MDQRTGRAGGLVALAAVVLLVLGAVVGFAGQTADTNRDDATVAARTTEDAATAAPTHSAGGDAAFAVAAPSTTVPAAAPGPANGASVAAGAPTTGVDQKIVKSGNVRLQVRQGQFRSSFDAASRVAGAHGGFVLSTESSAEKDRQASGLIVLRVPAAAFDAVRADLAKLGEVKEERISGNDVSGQLVDLDARIRSLTAQEDALRTLMAKAKTIGETVEVQGHLTQVRQQVEQLSGEKARLENQAALSTIRVEVFEPGAVPADPKPDGEPSPLRAALSSAVNGAETVVAGTIVVLGWALPLGVLAALVWLAYRPISRRLAHHGA